MGQHLWWRPNIDPTSTYTLCLPGNILHVTFYVRHHALVMNYTIDCGQNTSLYMLLVHKMSNLAPPKSAHNHNRCIGYHHIMLDQIYILSDVGLLSHLYRACVYRGFRSQLSKNCQKKLVYLIIEKEQSY